MGLLSLLGFRQRSYPTSTLSQPKQWLFDALGGGASNSGIAVTREKAITWSCIYGACNLISNTIAQCPTLVMRRTDKGSVESPDHALYESLRWSPNPEMSAFTFKRVMEFWRLIHGNAFALRDDATEPGRILLWPMDPLLTTVDRDLTTRELFYWYQTETMGTVRLEAKDVLHLKGLTGDGRTGYSVLTAARNAIGFGLATREYGERFYANSATPPTIIKVPSAMKEDTRKEFLKQWRKDHEGLKNQHKVSLLGDTFDVKSLAVPARDAMWVEGMEFTVRDIANFFNVPPSALGDSSRVSYNSLVEESAAYYARCINPILSCWQSEIRFRLLSEEERTQGRITIEFERQALIEANVDAQSQIFDRYLKNGVMTRNEVRDYLNLSPLDDGDELQIANPKPDVNTDDETLDSNSSDT